MHGFTRSMRPLIVGALLVGAAATGASAQIPFLGTTQACFYASPSTTCTPSTNTPPITSAFFLANVNNPTMTVTNGLNTLFFTNQNFGFTVPGPGASHTFQIGAFSFNATNPVQTLTNQFFVLSVLLSQPGGANPLYQATVTGKLQGFIAQNGTPGVTVNFNPPTQGPFAFNGGTFSLSVAGGSFYSDALNQPIYATATVTPEPVTMTLFGTGLGALALLRRRRKKNADRTIA